MDYFSSGLFEASLSLVGFLIIYGIIIYLMRNRIIKYILAQSDEKRFKLHQGFSKTMSVYKFLFWMSPIILVQIIFNLSIHRYDNVFVEISFGVIVYVAVLIVFLFSKMILKAADNGSEKK